MRSRITVLLVLCMSTLAALAVPQVTVEDRQQARLEGLAGSLEKKLLVTPVDDGQFQLYKTALESIQRQLGIEPQRLEFTKGAGTGVVSGRIVRSATGGGVGGATVSLVGSAFVSIQTNPAGYFSFTDLTFGDYFLYATPPGGENLAGAVLGNPGCAGSTCSALAYRGDRIRLDAAHEEQTGILLQLEPGARLSGRAVDAETNVRLAGARVSAYDANAGFMLFATADDFGNFEFTGLPARDVALTVGSPDHITTAVPELPCQVACDPASGGTIFTLTADQTLDVGTVAALPASFIEGTVTRADSGAPVEGALIIAWEEQVFAFSGFAVSDADGRYRMQVQPDYDHFVHVANSVFGFPRLDLIEQLYPDTPCVRFSCLNAVPRERVRSPTSGSIEANLALQREAPISGRVIDAATGEPIPGASVTARSLGGRFLQNSLGANENGEFLLQGLPADTYRLSASAGGYGLQYYPGFDCDGCDTRQSPTTTVGAEGVAGIDFALSATETTVVPQNRVAGVVVDEDQRSVTDLRVSFSRFGRGSSSTFVQQSGSFARSNFAPGLYHVRTTSSSSIINQVYPGIECQPVCDLSQGQRIHIVDGTQISRLDFTMRYGARVRGVVRDRDSGTSLAYMRVDAYDADGSFVQSAESGLPGGEFSLGGLPAGDYHLVTDAFYGRVNRSHDDVVCGFDRCATAGARVALAAGEQLDGFDFNLGIGGAIEGVVTQPDGAPGGYDFTAAMIDGRLWSYGYTAFDGSYHIGGLPPGLYNVRTFDEFLGFTATAIPGVPCPRGLCDPAALTVFEVTAEGPPAIADIELLPGATLSGTVTDALTGEPVQGITVSIRDADGEEVDSKLTNSGGLHLHTGLVPGEYFVQAAVGDAYLRGQAYPDVECPLEGCFKGAAQLISVAVGSPVENIDFALLRQNLFLTSPGISASWYDTGHDGEGFLVEMLAGGQALIYWFTYDKNGKQRWFLGTGTVVGATIEVVDFLEATGAVFGDGFDPAAVTLTRVGNAFFEFHDCGAGVVDFVIDGEIGHQDLSRLTNLEGVPCSENAKGVANVRSGSWYGGDARDGEGFLVQFLGDSALVVWFTYGLDGEQMWLIGTGSVEDEEIVIDELQVTSGGRFGDDFDPADVNREDWGSLTLRLGCDAGEVAWAANDEAFGSGGYAVERLTRIDGSQCTDAAKDGLTAR